jgi:thiamine-phosphate pyrophosphorylase
MLSAVWLQLDPLPGMKPLSECRLYAFVDATYLRGRAPDALARALCESGADLIQLRAKQCSREVVRQMAQCLLPVTRAAGVGLVLNDDFALAGELGADFCHLGQEDFFGAGYTHVSQLRSSPSAPRIGLSTHSPVEAQRAMAAGADYLGVGPVYPTGTKPEAKPVTLDYVRWAGRHVSVPWFAIGGINQENLAEVINAGARRICVVSAILCAPDPGAVCRRLRQSLDQASNEMNP